MPVIGITGGIATGKSTVSRLLAASLGAELFDSDQCAREVISRANVQEAIRNEFGPAVITPEGQLDRGALRAIVFADAERRRSLEVILHPVIRSLWMEQASAACETLRWLLVDIPLLFETGAEAHLDATVVVACSRATQLWRLTNVRAVGEPLASQMIAAQMKSEAKILLANHVIWNDSTMENLKEQTQLLHQVLLARYG